MATTTVRSNHGFEWTAHELPIGATVVHFVIGGESVSTSTVEVMARTNGK
jgi:hypothetical protein